MATLFFFLLLSQSAAGSASAINIWPKPSTISISSPPSFTTLSPSFRFHFVPNPRIPFLPPPPPPPLLHAFSNYLHLIFSTPHRPLHPPPHLNSSSLPLVSLRISISDASIPLRPSVDESYSLSIPTHSSTGSLSSATTWGAIRGLETLSQLAFSIGPSIFLPTGVSITDAPLFPHRGVLLDTSRNFYSIDDILRTIRAMAYTKLNVFHWHLTDSQSFPLLLPSEPRLALDGSYGPAMRYSPDDVRRVVEHAMSYGVRVVPEIDVPGHSASWAEAYPEIVTCAGKFWAPVGKPQLAAEPGTGQLNPLRNDTYRIVQNVFRDVARMFPDEYIHAGADEVNAACWEDDKSIREFLAAGGTHGDLLEIFVNNTHPYMVNELGRTVVYWEDVVLGSKVNLPAPSSSLPKESTILQTWNNVAAANTKKITAAGYRAIVSPYDHCYLDCGHGGWVGNDPQYDRKGDEGNGGSWCGPFKTWQRVYDYDILDGLTKEEASRVLGGEVALWSEQSDATVLDGRLWPRAAAMGEVLWSGNRDENGRKRYAKATGRLHEWRRRMVERGIGAEPIQPLWCATHPGMCDLTPAYR